MRDLFPLLPVAAITLFFATGPFVMASPTSTLAPVQFVFTGFKKQAGQVMAQLTCAEKPGDKGRLIPALADVRGPQVVIRFPDQRVGQVCTMRAFRDENGNQKLDMGPFGIPKEPFAFSNNAVATLGPPKAEATRFVVQSGQNSQTIQIK
jgi:uncharacterized protein (DUF2141 family)